MNLIRLGTSYGGWTVPIDLLKKDFICYCVGAGEDISFETILAQNYDINVYIFDPTPRAEKHFNNLLDNIKNNKEMRVGSGNDELYIIKKDKLNNLKFYPYGLWSKKEIRKFYAPQNPLYVSHSIYEKNRSKNFFEAQCYTIKNLIEFFGHNFIDLLKMDIEGAENEVIKNMFQDHIYPKILCVEIDQEYYKESLIKLILNNNYTKIYSYGITEKFTFIKT